MAGAVQCLYTYWGLSSIFESLSLTSSSQPNAAAAAFRPLSFSANTSLNIFARGFVSISPVQRPPRHLVVCEAAPANKADSAA